MQKRYKQACLGLLCFLLLSLATGCGGPEPPEAYALGLDHAPPLDDQLGEDGGKLDKVEPSAKEEAESSSGEGSGPEQYIYTYKKLTAAGETVENYAKQLEGEGFQPVDETGAPADAPDYSAESGTVLLAKEAESAEGYRFQIGLDWTEKECVVTVQLLENPEVVVEGMTVVEAIDFLRAQSPYRLGLTGSSMDAYSIYPMDGAVLVDGTPCLRLQVYTLSEENTNQLAGVYFLSADKAHLYRLDTETNNVLAIQLS